MQEMDQRDRELLGALQGETPLVSTPFAVLGQVIDMSEKEVIKRTERLKREGVMDQTIVVATSPADPAPLLYLAPYAGCAMGEEWMALVTSPPQLPAQMPFAR